MAHLEQERLEWSDALGASLAHVLDERGAHALVGVEKAALVRARARVGVGVEAGEGSGGFGLGLGLGLG